MIAVKLLIWKNIMDKERTLKTLQDSVAWIRKPFHQSAASATRITTWQTTWRPNNIQHFLVNLYFFHLWSSSVTIVRWKRLRLNPVRISKEELALLNTWCESEILPWFVVELSCIDVCLESAQLSYQHREEPREVWTRTEKHRNGYPSMILILHFWFVRNKRKKSLKNSKINGILWKVWGTTVWRVDLFV